MTSEIENFIYAIIIDLQKVTIDCEIKQVWAFLYKINVTSFIDKSLEAPSKK